MKQSTTVQLLAASGVALLALSACGGSDSSSSTSSSTTSAAPAASDATSPAASDTASSAPSGSASAPTTTTKAWTNASLAAVMPKIDVNGVHPEAAPADKVAQLDTALNSVGEVMRKATVTPEACKQNNLKNLQLSKNYKAIAMGGSNSLPVIIMVRAVGDPATAKQLMAGQAEGAQACKTFTMTVPSTKFKATATTEAKSIDFDGVDDDYAMQTTTKTTGTSTGDKTTVQTSGGGSMGNLVIQAVSTNGAVPDAQLKTVVEAAAKAYADASHS